MIERGPADRRLGARDDFRALLAAGLSARRRRPGVHHRGRQPQADPAHRDHAAVHLVRRLVAAGERGRRRPAARAVRSRRRSRRRRPTQLRRIPVRGTHATARSRAADARRTAPPSTGDDPRCPRHACRAGRPRRRPLRRPPDPGQQHRPRRPGDHARVRDPRRRRRLLAGGRGAAACPTARQPGRHRDRPAPICAAGSSTATDRVAGQHASATRTASRYREYRRSRMSPVIGYASRQFGTAGLERTYDSELIGLRALGPRPRPAQASSTPTPYDPQASDALDLARAPARGRARRSATTSGRGRDARPAVPARCSPSPPRPSTTRSADRQPGHRRREAFAALQRRRPPSAAARATQGRYVPGSVFKIVTAIAGLDCGRISPVDDVRGAARRRARTGSSSRASGSATAIIRRPVTRRSTSPAPPRSQLQHLVRARRARDRRRPAGRLGRPRSGFGDADPVRPADGGQPGDERRRRFAGRVQRRRRAGVTPSFGQGRDVRDAAPDGARGVDRRQRRRADAPHLVRAITGEGPGTRTIEPSDLAPRARRRTTRGRSRRRCRRRSRASWASSSRPARRCRGVPTAGKSGTAELGGTGEPHSWFIGFAPVDNPRVAIAVLVERGGRGGERAAPLAGSLMERYFELYGTP